MGAGGEDLVMARAAREKFPYSIECKNQEKLNVWKSYDQALENCGKYQALLVIKKNNRVPLIVIDATFFIGIHGRRNRIQQKRECTETVLDITDECLSKV